MRMDLNIEGDRKRTTSINVDENVSSIGKLTAVLPEVERVIIFDDFTVERGGVEIFDGRIQEPSPRFSSAGLEHNIMGYDYTVLLKDYLTPSTSIVDSDTDTVLTEALSETPFTLNLLETFQYLDNATIFNSTREFLDLTFNDTGIEYIISTEISEEVDTGVNVLPDPEFRSTFWAKTATTDRHFIFYSDGGANLKYRHTDDGGVTWSAEVDSGVAIVSNHFSLMYHLGVVFLFIEDAGGRTDVYSGIVDDLTGGIIFAIHANNIFNNWMQAGPWVDVDGDIWVIENTGGNNDAWESTDLGLTWNNMFTGQEVIKYMLPQDTDGDMWCFELDTINNHFELWDYDRSAGAPEVYVSLIRDFGADALQHIAGAQNPDYNIYLAYSDDDFDLWFRYATSTGVWAAEESVTTTLIEVTSFHITADKIVSGYLAVMSAAGFSSVKIKAGVYGDLTILESTEQGGYVTAPASSLLDGEYSCHFSWIGFADDLWFTLLQPYGITIERGYGVGTFQTSTITATGSMINWGWVTGDGLYIQRGSDIVWDILDPALNVLLNDKIVPFDMYQLGLDPAETQIIVRATLTNNIGNPYVYEFDYSEYVDQLTIDFDYDDCYTALNKWSTISEGEFWVTEDGGAFTVNVGYRGRDRSSSVILKNALSNEYPEVVPNVKIVSYTPDWGSFANIIMVIGAGTGSSRIEQEARNQDSVNTYDEHWSSIRNQDIMTDAMARSVGALALDTSGTVIKRVTAELVDKNESTLIEVGDLVTVSFVFSNDVDVDLNQTMRIVALNRDYSSSGERVLIELSSQNKATLFYDYLLKTNSLERWVTS